MAPYLFSEKQKWVLLHVRRPDVLSLYVDPKDARNGLDPGPPLVVRILKKVEWEVRKKCRKKEHDLLSHP